MACSGACPAGGYPSFQVVDGQFTVGPAYTGARFGPNSTVSYPNMLGNLPGGQCWGFGWTTITSPTTTIELESQPCERNGF